MLLQQHDEIVTLGSPLVHGRDASVPRVAGGLMCRSTSDQESSMRHALLLSAALAGFSAVAGAQQAAAGIKLSDVAGVWDGKSMMGPKDSVVVTSVMTLTADGKGWTLAFPNRAEPVSVRVVSMGGDSIVTEAGPYPSALRPGVTVKLLQMVGHYKGNEMWGTWAAQYDGGDKAAGKLSGTRRK
jgi:hypothetical protein